MPKPGQSRITPGFFADMILSSIILSPIILSRLYTPDLWFRIYSPLSDF
jgi:hypothetical protein